MKSRGEDVTLSACPDTNKGIMSPSSTPRTPTPGQLPVVSDSLRRRSETGHDERGYSWRDQNWIVESDFWSLRNRLLVTLRGVTQRTRVINVVSLHKKEVKTGIPPSTGRTSVVPHHSFTSF